MLSRIAHFIDANGLLRHDGRYIVGVSGGADSVCLLLALQRLGYHVEAAHCNFQLRGDESKRDEQFVVSLCKENNIKTHLIHFDTITYSTLHHVSIEMAARTLRYNYFECLLNDIGADAICVAHHQDDSVETLLMNLMRGTGLHGLKGIQPRHNHVVRPLLCVTRNDIEDWLRRENISYVTDSTNLQPDILRNCLRLNIIPQLKKYNPAFTDSILKTARLVDEATKIIEVSLADALDRLVTDDAVNIAQLSGEPSPLSVLHEWLSPYGFSSATVFQIADRLSSVQSGNSWQSDTHMVYVHRHCLHVVPINAQRPSLTVPETGKYKFDDHTHFCFQISTGRQIERDRNKASLDASLVSFPLTIRPIEMGDLFHPFGMRGTKLVSDYLTDRHCSIVQKRSQLVVTNADGQIIWLVDQRPDQRFSITPATTATLTISCITEP